MDVIRGKYVDGLLELWDPHRYVAAVDIECTCDDFAKANGEEDKIRELLVKREEMETIEVGVVILDRHAGMARVGEFSRFVKPVIKPKLTEFCIKLTSITQSDVDGADYYSLVQKDLDTFLEPFRSEGLMWCSWGQLDSQQLLEDAKRASCPPMFDGAVHTNLKWWHCRIFHTRAMGMKRAIKSSGLEWEGSHHRALSDAQNLANLIRDISEKIKLFDTKT